MRWCILVGNLDDFCEDWLPIIFVHPPLQRNAIAINALWYRDRGNTTANL
jgi:hypothetical protein